MIIRQIRPIVMFFLHIYNIILVNIILNNYEYNCCANPKEAGKKLIILLGSVFELGILKNYILYIENTKNFTVKYPLLQIIFNTAALDRSCKPHPHHQSYIPGCTILPSPQDQYRQYQHH